METPDTTYNGWTNYETWRVNLELCEDYCNSLAQDRQTFRDENELAGVLKEYVEEVLTIDSQAIDISLAVSYALAFISDVDWHEIAEHWTDELIEQDEEEEATA